MSPLLSNKSSQTEQRSSQKPRLVSILGSGQYVPPKVVSAEMVDARLGVRSDWTKNQVGVLSRYYVTDETASYLGAQAALQALKRAGLSPHDVDCIVATSGTMQQPIPCNAALIQQALGLGDSGIPAFDINSTCLSFVVGLDLMSRMVDVGAYRTVLVVASEIASKGLNWKHKESAALFGDGAAAVVIQRSSATDSSRILTSRMETYSKGAEFSQIQGGGTMLTALEKTQDNEAAYRFEMNGKGLFKLSSQILPGFVERLLEPVALSLSAISLVIPHQASYPALCLMRKRLNIPASKFFINVQQYGNTIAASIPMALHQAIESGKIQRGDRVMLLGTSAGFSVGGLVLEY